MIASTTSGHWMELPTTEEQRRHNRAAFALLVWCYPGDPRWRKRIAPTVGSMWYCEDSGRVWRYQEVDR